MPDDVGAELQRLGLQVRRGLLGEANATALRRHLAVEALVLVLVDLLQVVVDLVDADRAAADLRRTTRPRRTAGTAADGGSSSAARRSTYAGMPGRHDRDAEGGLAGPSRREQHEHERDAHEEEHRAAGIERASRTRHAAAAPLEPHEPDHGEAQEGHGHEDEVGHDRVERAEGDEHRGQRRLDGDRARRARRVRGSSCPRRRARRRPAPSRSRRRGAMVMNANRLPSTDRTTMADRRGPLRRRRGLARLGREGLARRRRLEGDEVQERRRSPPCR